MTRSLAAKKHAGPLEPFLVAVGDGLPTLGGVARQVVKNIETVFFLFVFFDLVQLTNARLCLSFVRHLLRI
jgi:hypothetical protein